MISASWRQRLGYAAMSAFIVWHALAIAIAPVPAESAIGQALRPILQPYLTFFSLDNKWDFYAPAVNIGRQFRYVVNDASGKPHAFVATDGLIWIHPDYWWFRSWYDAVMDYPETYADELAVLLCRKHAALKPASIDLIKRQQGDFTPQDYLSGKQPLDSEFAAATTIKRVTCPAQ